MRTRAVLFTTSLFLLSAAHATAQESNWDTEVSVGIETGRQFADQAYRLSTDPAYTFDATACTGTEERYTCFNVWHTDSISMNREDRETDFTATHAFAAGSGELEFSGSYYEISGKDIWRGEVAYTLPITEACESRFSAEVQRGGFETNTARVGVSCEVSMSEDWSVDLGPTLVYDSSIRDMVLVGELGVTRSLGENLSVRFGVQGFASDGHRGAVGSIVLTRRFGD